MMQTQSKAALTTAVLVALGVVWGSAFILMKVLLEEISPSQIVAARLLLGGVLVATVAFARGRLTLPSFALVGPAALLVFLDNMVPNTLVAWSETRIDSGMAALLISTMPLFTTILAITVLKEGVTASRIAGIIVGFIGVMIVSDGAVLDARSNNGIGMLAVVAAASCHAVAAIYTRNLLGRFDALRLTAYKLGAGALMMAPIVLATQGTGDYGAMSLKGVACLLVLGLVSTGIAYAAYIWLFGAPGAVHASLVTYVIPIAGLVLAWSLLGESISVSTILGGMVIVCGVAIAMFG